MERIKIENAYDVLLETNVTNREMEERRREGEKRKRRIGIR